MKFEIKQEEAVKQKAEIRRFFLSQIEGIITVHAINYEGNDWNICDFLPDGTVEFYSFNKTIHTIKNSNGEELKEEMGADE